MTPGRIVLVLWPAALLLSIGCGGNGAPPVNQRDPLIGNGPPIPKEGSKEARAVAGPLPVPGAPGGEVSPAALATGAAPRRDGDFRIPTDPADAWRSGSPSGVSLSRPEPVRDAPLAPAMPAVPTVGGAVGPSTDRSVASVDQGLRLLELRGVKGFRLEQQRETGQWRCTCSIPDRQNPAFKRTYDTNAADPVSAVRAVVEQVERDVVR